MIVADSWMYDLLQTVFYFWSNCCEKIWHFLTTPASEFHEGVVWDVMASINDGIKFIAYALLVTFFMMGVIRELTNFTEVKRLETLFKMLFRYIFANAMVTYCMQIMNLFSSVFIKVIERIVSSSEWEEMQIKLGVGFFGNHSATDKEWSLYWTLSTADFWESIPMSLIVIVGAIIIVVLSIIALFTVYGRFFKIYIYTALAPLPLSTLAGEPTQHTGIQFLKSYAGVLFEGAIIAIACIIYTKLAQTSTISNLFLTPAGNYTSDLIEVLAYITENVFNMLIMLGVIKGASQIQKEMTNL